MGKGSETGLEFMKRKIAIALSASVFIGLIAVSSDALAYARRGGFGHGYGWRHVTWGSYVTWGGYHHGYGWHGYGPSRYGLGVGLAGLAGYPGGFCYILTPHGVRLTC